MNEFVSANISTIRHAGTLIYREADQRELKDQTLPADAILKQKVPNKLVIKFFIFTLKWWSWRGLVRIISRIIPENKKVSIDWKFQVT